MPEPNCSTSAGEGGRGKRSRIRRSIFPKASSHLLPKTRPIPLIYPINQCALYLILITVVHFIQSTGVHFILSISVQVPPYHVFLPSWLPFEEPPCPALRSLLHKKLHLHFLHSQKKSAHFQIAGKKNGSSRPK